MALPLTRMIAMGLLFGAGIQPAAAQTYSTFTPPRADAAACFGWFGANKSELDGYRDWYRPVWHGSLSAGYYWTENLKTELDVGGTTRGEIYEIPRPANLANSVNQGAVDHEFSTRRLTLGQHYQFFHNAFFHPTIGGGVALTWETTEREFPAVFVRDPPVSSRQIPTIRQVEPGRTEGPETRLRTMAFAATGFKAYFARRGFFRSDLRVMFTDRVEDVTLRSGFGVDF
ncbi:MAG: hypothetical protein ACRD09_13545 [Vicinamibacterales bacterium]